VTEILRDISGFAGELETEDGAGVGRLVSTGGGPFTFRGVNGGSVGLIWYSTAPGGLLVDSVGLMPGFVLWRWGRCSGSTREECQYITNDFQHDALPVEDREGTTG
jgi:hypothetical protein